MTKAEQAERTDSTIGVFWNRLESFLTWALRFWEGCSMPVRLFLATLLIILAGALTPSCELDKYRFCMCNLAQGTCLILVLCGGPMYAVSCFFGLLFFNATESYTPLGDSYFSLSLAVSFLYFLLGLGAKTLKVRMNAISSVMQFFLFIVLGIVIPLIIAWFVVNVGAEFGIFAPMLKLADPSFATRLVYKSFIGSFLGALVCFTLYQPFLNIKSCRSYSCVRSFVFVTATLSCMVWLFHNQVQAEVLDNKASFQDQTDNLRQAMSFQFDLRLRAIQDVEYMLIGNISGFVSDGELEQALKSKGSVCPWDYVKLCKVSQDGKLRLTSFKIYNEKASVSNAEVGMVLPSDPLISKAISETQRLAALRDKSFGSEFVFEPKDKILRVVRPCYLGSKVVGVVEVGISFADLISRALQEFNLNNTGVRISYFNKLNDAGSKTTKVYEKAYEALSLFSYSADIGFNESNAKHVFRLDFSYNPDCGIFLMNSFKHFDLYVMFLAFAGALINLLMDQNALISDKAHQLLKDLDERERYNSSITKSMNDGLVALDCEGRIVSANDAVCSLFGFGEEDIKGKNLHDLAHRGHECVRDLSCPSGRYFKELRSLDLHSKDIDSKLNRRLSSFVVDKKGEIVNYDSDFSLMHRDNGEVNVIVIMRNVDAEVKLNNIRSEFVAKLSHEMRTPLSCIKGAVDMFTQFAPKMVSKQGFTQAGEQMLEVARRNVARLGQLVNDVLLCDSVDNNSLHLERTRQLVAPIVEKTVRNMREEADSKNVTLRITKLEGETYFDELRLGQVLYNLISNAIKYSDAGSEVCIESVVDKDGSKIVFKVQDFGCGIPKDKQGLIFNRYSLSRSETMRTRVGLGLGLTICSGLVKAHGGEIWVESEVKRGSSFFFTLPIVS